MATLRLFNPQNDLALAAGLAAYTPPGPAAAFASAGALLPAWWSNEGDVIAATADRAGEAAWLRREYGLTADVCEGSHADAADPWGWSANAALLLRHHGCDPSLIPQPETLDRLRNLSHRRTAMALRDAISADRGAEVTTEAEIREFLRRHDGHVFAKSPWSCSGRGVMPLASMSIDRAIEAVKGIIRRQGSAMLEKASAPGTDFAALFEVMDGATAFSGWSVFDSSASGAYTGNIVAPQAKLRSMLAERTDINTLENIVRKLEKALDSIVAPHYRGPLGIDMLASADGALNPCIELNLRRTMGFVARDVNTRLGVEGRLTMNVSDNGVKLCRRRGPFGIGVEPA